MDYIILYVRYFENKMYSSAIVKVILSLYYDKIYYLKQIVYLW